VIILASAAFNILLVTYSLFAYHTKLPKYNLDELEYRSTYIGFDRLYSNTSYAPTKFHPLINRPRFMSSVWSDEPTKVAQLWPTRFLSPDGFVPVAERRLKVTNSVRELQVL
jgi:hypothetical protein